MKYSILSALLLIGFALKANASFVADCTQPLNDAQLKTIKALFNKAGTKGAPSNETCTAAWEKLSQIESLDLSGRKLTDISVLSHFSQLRALNLSGNALASIDGLGELTSLEVLVLSNSQASDIALLKNLVRLTYLDLATNNISDLQALGSLNSLQNLNLAKNNISNLAAISSLEYLRYLSLAENKVTDVSALSGLTDLRLLNISSNPVLDYQPLSDLEATHSDSSGKFINLEIIGKVKRSEPCKPAPVSYPCQQTTSPCYHGCPTVPIVNCKKCY